MMLHPTGTKETAENLASESELPEIKNSGRHYIQLRGVGSNDHRNIVSSSQPRPLPANNTYCLPVDFGTILADRSSMLLPIHPASLSPVYNRPVLYKEKERQRERERR